MFWIASLAHSELDFSQRGCQVGGECFLIHGVGFGVPAGTNDKIGVSTVTKLSRSTLFTQDVCSGGGFRAAPSRNHFASFGDVIFPAGNSVGFAETANESELCW